MKGVDTVTPYLKFTWIEKIDRHKLAAITTYMNDTTKPLVVVYKMTADVQAETLLPDPVRCAPPTSFP